MRHGDGVYTPRKRDAKRLARAVDPAGRVDYHDPHVNRETGTADGRYSHYHPATTHQGHAWFGTAA